MVGARRAVRSAFWSSRSTCSCSRSRCPRSRPTCTPPRATCSGSSTRTAWCSRRRCCRPGMLGDRIGRKRLLIGALALFGLASLACAYSTSAGELIAARAVLGLAAAVILPMSLAVLPVLFTAAERPRAIAAVGGATFLGYPIGPILGGWLLDHFWWGSVFLINIPVVVIAIIAVVAADAGVARRAPQPRRRDRHRDVERRPDGADLRADQGGRRRLVGPRVAVVTMVAGVVALAAFVGLGDGWSAPAHEPPARTGDAGAGPAVAAGGPRAVRLGRIHLGHRACRRWSRSRCSGSSSRCRSTSSTCAALTRSAAGCGCCR